jgi:hypothetical protein
MPMPVLWEFSESMAALLVPRSDRNKQLFQSHWTWQGDVVLKIPTVSSSINVFTWCGKICGWQKMQTANHVMVAQDKVHLIWSGSWDSHSLLSEEIQILLREDHFTTLKTDQHGVSTVQGQTTWDTSAHSTIRLAMHIKYQQMGCSLKISRLTQQLAWMGQASVLPMLQESVA